MTDEECEENGMTATCDDMDPVMPSYLLGCTTDVPVIPKTDLETYTAIS